ncbi:MAG TPA: two-component regulator propeller domain-containing protein, partial [Parafilimonas sp.]
KIDTVNTRLTGLGLSGKNPYAVSVSGNSVWMVQNNFTLIHLNPDLDILASYHLPNTIYPSFKCGVEDNNKYWLETYQDGIFEINRQTGRVQHHSAGNISSGLKDDKGNIWIGTTAGVNEWRQNGSFFHQVNFNIPDSISSKQFIQRIFVQKNTLFAFTLSGLMLSHFTNNASRYFVDNNSYYSTVYPFNDKWFVCRNHRLKFLQIKNNRFIFSAFIVPHPSMFDSSDVVSFYKDDNKNIWMGLSNDAGIVCWHTVNNSFTFYSQKSKGKNFCPLRHFRYALEDNKKNIWFGYEKGGIAIFDKQRQRFISPPRFKKDSISNEVVSGMIDDHKNHLWIATNAGLIRYDELSKSYQRFSRKEGLPSNDIFGIEQDEAGNIWAGFEGALASINISTNKIITYSTSDGLPDEQLQNPLYDSVSKNMFFCADHNVIYFNPQQVKKIIPKLNPIITSLQVMGKEQSFYANKKLELPYSQNYLSFNFSAPNFINASENEYACKLDGTDKNWNYLGNQHVANYSQLQPGNYIFHVKARVKNGGWQQASVPVVITILTPFWRTIWFWILCVASCLCIIFSFVYLRLRNKLEKQILSQSIRDKIAGDLHDDIGSTLSSISILSELAKQKSSEAVPFLNRIEENTLLIQENMSDIVWAINPKNDRFANIIQRMSQFASELLESKNIEVNFSSDESLSSVLLPMEKRKNFYLLFKEAINNCAKYSNALRVKIAVTNADHQINLIIEDDGKGFDTEKKYSGNGMNTMKNRAALLNGTLEINSEKNKGTALQLTFTV